MKIGKCLRRDLKINKREKGHQEDGRSVFTIKRLQKERALRIRKEQLQKQELLEGE